MAEKRVSVRLVVEGGRVVRAELDGMGADGERAFRRVERSAEAASGMVRRLVGLFAAGFSLNAIRQATDQFTGMNNALLTLGDSQAQVNDQIDRLTEIALATHQPLESIVQLYQRARIAGTELGASQDDMFAFVQATALALAQQGGAAQEASGALLQLSQAIGGSVVRAEEFNSMQEGAPAILRAVAAGIAETGGSIARLREMMVDGRLTSELFFNALISQAPSLAANFERARQTIGQSLTDLHTAFTVFIGDMDQASGASGVVAGAISGVAHNLDAFAAIAAGLVATQLPALIAGLRALAIAASLAAGPWGIVIGLVAAGASYLLLFRDRARELPPEMRAAQEAQDALNQALARFAGEASPTARAEVVAHAASLREMKEAALGAAEAELALIEANNAAAEQRLADAGAAMPFGTALGQSEANDARQRVEQLREEIARLRETEANPEAAAAGLETLTVRTEAAVSVTRDLGAASTESAEAGVEGWARVTEALNGYRDAAGDTASQVADLISGGMKHAEDAILDAFKGGTDGARAFFSYIAEQLARMMIRNTILAPLSNWLGGFFPGSASVAVGHSGMVAGGAGGVTRSVPATVFAGAQRFHSGGWPGLASDEVPAILQRGERVLSRSEVSRSTAATPGPMRVMMGFDSSMGAFTGYVLDATGKQLAAATPQIVGQSVAATHASFREYRPR